MSLVTWLFGMLCSRLCGGLGAAVGIVGGALALILLSALATGAGQDPRILEWDPAGFPGECFVEQRIFLKKPAFCCWKRRQWWPRQAGSFAGEIFSQRKETDKP